MGAGVACADLRVACGRLATPCDECSPHSYSACKIKIVIFFHRSRIHGADYSRYACCRRRRGFIVDALVLSAYSKCFVVLACETVCAVDEGRVWRRCLAQSLTLIFLSQRLENGNTWPEGLGNSHPQGLRYTHPPSNTVASCIQLCRRRH